MKVQRKKSTQHQHIPIVGMSKSGKAKEDTTEMEGPPSESEGPIAQEPLKNDGEGFIPVQAPVGEDEPPRLDDPPPLVEFEENYAWKQLKLDEMPEPNNCYTIECIVEKLDGSISVAFFKNPGKDGLEPYLPLFKNVWVDNVEEELQIHGIGNRCDSNHQFKRNKRNISDISTMQYGWRCFINESIKDPGDWAIHLCNTLNDSEPYKNSFDFQRTNGRQPHFQVVHVVYPEEGKRRKLDQVMMDDDIAKYLVKKHNLKNYGVRRRLKTDEHWNEMLQPYFVDANRGRKIVLKYLDVLSGVSY